MTLRQVTGRKYCGWFKKHSGQFQGIILPPSPPAMNPIEYRWDMIDSYVSQLWTTVTGSMAEYFFKGLQRLVELICHIELLKFAGQKGVPHDIVCIPSLLVLQCNIKYTVSHTVVNIFF